MMRDAAVLAGVFGGGALLTGGPSAVFAALPAAQLAYASLCRSSGARAGSQFDQMLGASMAAHLAAVTFPALRSVLKLPAPTPATLLWFAAGATWPWLTGRARDEIVVKRSQPDPLAGPRA